ncbi:MAG: replication factor C small subunit [Candidatus Parvarchaeota archaeon]|jgi:replication factor C small subunit|nr:replication factor C small subunit [Candidatus Parvarchaeota archaeon]MCL5420202.1 replication factor C small subunit [Candidatus Parvarchaeota archaeon]
MALWIEKYRPQSFDEIIGQKEIIEKLKAMAEKKEIQHMILSGPPGVGKTTSAVVLAKEVFGSTTWNQNFIELNASDDRKLSVIQGKVKEFARTKPIDAPFKIILFDEADSLTQEAQQALRRMMEEYSATCRFIFSVNYQSNIIEPLQSRCAILRFQPLSKSDVHKFIERIAGSEKLEVDSEAMDALDYVSRGDLRTLVNLLQSLSNVSKKIDAKAVLQSSGLMDISKTIEGLKTALSGDFKRSRELFSEIIDSGINMKELLISIFNVISTTDIVNEKVKNYVFEKLAETDYRIVEGATPFIQFQAFLAFLSSLK